MKKPFKNPETMNVIISMERWREIIQTSDDKKKTLILFTSKLAVAIQIKMNNGDNLCGAAKASLKEVSEDFCDKGLHVSTFMKGEAIDILSEVWSMGKELKKWYFSFCDQTGFCF